MRKLVKAAFLVAAIAHVFGSATFTHVYAQGTTSSSSFPDTPSRYPESDQVSQALQQAAVCDCSCEAIRPDGTRTTPAELLKGNGAQMACSTCCESEELLQAMSELLPVSESSGLLHLLLSCPSFYCSICIPQSPLPVRLLEILTNIFLLACHLPFFIFLF